MKDYKQQINLLSKQIKKITNSLIKEQSKNLLLEKENNDEYKITLLNEEVEHFELAIVLNKRIKQRFPTYNIALVGGACRDLFYRKFFGKDNSKIINDLDFSIFDNKTSKGLNKLELQELSNFISSDEFAVVEELDFLHLKVIHRDSQKEIEFTSTRKEAYRDNSRKPETVVGSVIDDILRRDFTVNAIYLNILKVENDTVFVKPVNNRINQHINDIKNKILKTTTADPKQIFDEDPLRVLRAIRFSGYSYDMEKNISDYIGEFDKDVLFNKVSVERIADELGKILKKGDVDYLIKSGFINKLMEDFDEFNDKEYKEYELEHIVNVIKQAREKAPADRKLTFLLVALFHDLGKANTGVYSDKKERWTFHNHEEDSASKAKKILTKFKFSNKLIRDVSNIVKLHMETKFFLNVPDTTIIRWILTYSNVQKFPQLIENVLLFNEIDWGGKSAEWRELNKDRLLHNEILNKVLDLKKEIDELKIIYSDDLKDIAMRIGKDKNIQNSSKSKAILKAKAKFLFYKIKNK